MSRGLLIGTLLLAGCASKAPPEPVVVAPPPAVVQDLGAVKAGVDAVRGLWALDLQPAELAYARAMQAVLGAGVSVDDAVQGLSPEQAERVRRRVANSALRAQEHEVFDAIDRVFLLLKPDRYMMRAGGYVFAEGPVSWVLVEEGVVDLHLPLDDGTELIYRATVEGRQMSLEHPYGGFAWLLGHDGAMSLRKEDVF